MTNIYALKKIRPYIYIYSSQSETEELGIINVSNVRIDYNRALEQMIKVGYILIRIERDTQCLYSVTTYFPYIQITMHTSYKQIQNLIWRIGWKTSTHYTRWINIPDNTHYDTNYAHVPLPPLPLFFLCHVPVYDTMLLFLYTLIPKDDTQSFIYHHSQSFV